MMLEMAERNSMTDEVPFKSESEAQAMFEYENLQQFLDLRDASLQVVHKAQKIPYLFSITGHSCAEGKPRLKVLQFCIFSGIRCGLPVTYAKANANAR